jgi:PBP superfamily domain
VLCQHGRSDAPRVAQMSSSVKGGTVRTSRLLAGLVILVWLLAASVPSASGDLATPTGEGTSHGENAVFTFNSVVIKCPLITDTWKNRKDDSKQGQVSKGHIDEIITYKECVSGFGSVGNFTCGIEYKPSGVVKFEEECLIEINGGECQIDIPASGENTNLGEATYTNRTKPAVELETTSNISGISYTVSGKKCAGLEGGSAGTLTSIDFIEGAKTFGLQCEAITGSGTPAQSHLQSTFLSSVTTPNCEIKPEISYIASSSRLGLLEWGASSGMLELGDAGVPSKLDAFVSADVAPEGPASSSGTELNNINDVGGPVVTVPVAQSAVAMLVSMPAGCVLGTVAEPTVEYKPLEEEWYTNTNSLEKLVRIGKSAAFTGCPTKAPTLYARSTANGTTAVFKHFLYQADPAHWIAFVESDNKAEDTNWPATVSKINATGREEAERVLASENSIGYAELADARAAGFSSTPTTKGSHYSFFVQVQNASGPTKFAAPEATGGASNCKAAEYDTMAEGTKLTVAPNTDWSHAWQTKALEGAAEKYPICALTFDLAWQHYKRLDEGSNGYGNDEETVNSVFQYFSYMVGEGQALTKLLTEHYAPLPRELTKLVREGVTSSHIGLF